MLGYFKKLRRAPYSNLTTSEIHAQLTELRRAPYSDLTTIEIHAQLTELRRAPYSDLTTIENWPSFEGPRIQIWPPLRYMHNWPSFEGPHIQIWPVTTIEIHAQLTEHIFLAVLQLARLEQYAFTLSMMPMNGCIQYCSVAGLSTNPVALFCVACNCKPHAYIIHPNTWDSGFIEFAGDSCCVHACIFLLICHLWVLVRLELL